MGHPIITASTLILAVATTVAGMGCVAKIFGTTFKNPDDAFKYAVGSAIFLPVGFTLMALFGSPVITSLWRFPVVFALALLIGAMTFSFSGTWHLLRPTVLKTSYVAWVRK